MKFSTFLAVVPLLCYALAAVVVVRGSKPLALLYCGYAISGVAVIWMDLQSVKEDTATDPVKQGRPKYTQLQSQGLPKP